MFTPLRGSKPGLAELAQVSGIFGHLQLEAAVARHRKLFAGLEGHPGFLTRQLHCQGTPDHDHQLGSSGIEQILAWSHNAHSGIAARIGEVV